MSAKRTADRLRPVDLVFDEPGRMITEGQLCAALQISTATARRWRAEESDPLPFRRLPNGQVRLELWQVRAWLTRNAAKDGDGFRRGGAAA